MRSPSISLNSPRLEPVRRTIDALELTIDHMQSVTSFNSSEDILASIEQDATAMVKVDALTAGRFRGAAEMAKVHASMIYTRKSRRQLHNIPPSTGDTLQYLNAWSLG